VVGAALTTGALPSLGVVMLGETGLSVGVRLSGGFTIIAGQASINPRDRLPVYMYPPPRHDPLWRRISS
jgi:hypothetical protein